MTPEALFHTLLGSARSGKWCGASSKRRRESCDCGSRRRPIYGMGRASGRKKRSPLTITPRSWCGGTLMCSSTAARSAAGCRGTESDDGAGLPGAAAVGRLEQTLHAGLRGDGVTSDAADASGGGGPACRGNRYAAVADAQGAGRRGLPQGRLERGGLRRLRRTERAQGPSVCERVLRSDRQTRPVRDPGKDKTVWQSFVAEMDRHNGHPGRSRKSPST